MIIKEKEGNLIIIYSFVLEIFFPPKCLSTWHSAKSFGDTEFCKTDPAFKKLQEAKEGDWATRGYTTVKNVSLASRYRALWEREDRKPQTNKQTKKERKKKRKWSWRETQRRLLRKSKNNFNKENVYPSQIKHI